MIPLLDVSMLTFYNYRDGMKDGYYVRLIYGRGGSADLGGLSHEWHENRMGRTRLSML